ncbi:MAG: TonB-dependent receptor, partial [Pirellulaceae bacterium]
MHQKLILALIIGGLGCSSLWAQQTSPGTAAVRPTNFQQEESAEPTLPPVDVLPPESDPEPAPDVPPPTGLDLTAPTASPFPSLAEQVIGDFESGLRGPRESVFDSPRAIEIISRQQLLERSPIDMGQALEQSTSVMVQRTGRGQSSPYLRGLTGQQVLILVDGVRMTNSTFRAGPNQYFNTIDPNMVERVEVIRGGGSVLYGGDAIGGVINIVTKKAQFRGENFLTGGTTQRFSSADLGYTGRIDAEAWYGNTGVYGGGGYGNYNDLDIAGSPIAPEGFDPGRQPASSWGYRSADVKINYRVDDYSELVFGLQHYSGEDIFRTDRAPANRESVFDPQVRDLYMVRYQGHTDERGIFDTFQITASLHRFDETRIDRDFRPGREPLLFSNRSFFDEQTGVTGSFTKDLEAFGTLSYGFDWYHDEIGSSRTDIDRSVGPPTVTNLPGEVPDDAYYSRYGGYLQWDVWLTDRWKASAGTRYEHVTAGATVTVPGDVSTRIDPSYGAWVGSFGLTYELTEEIHLVGSINEAFRAPNIDDLATVNENVFTGVQLPNPDLAPEKSITYELGAKLNTERFHAQTFVWWNDLRNYIVRGAPNAENLLDRTNGHAYLNGAELSAEYLLDDTWSLYGNYWYTYGRDRASGEPLSRIPPMQGIVGLRSRWNGGRDWFDVYGWLVDKQDRL